jgi:L-2-hydroxyglutarate oxidase LhgO
MDQMDCIVIGAGVVGLAIARHFASEGHEVLILEAEGDFGTGISSRNSEVIHAGIYYPQGSLKARLCVEGRRRLYGYCVEHGVAHRRCGKLIVATNESQRAVLQDILRKARNNGVEDIGEITADEARALEPELRCVAALQSPSTGIVDSHGLMLALLGDAERMGALLALRSPVIGGHIVPDGIVLHVGGIEPMSIHARTVINSAGLGAQGVAALIEGVPVTSIPPLSLAKGNYYALSGRSPFSCLIYPVPEAAGLGVHLTLDMGGQARFGPDVEWVDTVDYTVDPARADNFYGEIRRYWPRLADGALAPAYAGIRPKPHLRHESARDFIISGASDHGVPSLVNLYGIESPGLTSALALAEVVYERSVGATL